MASLVDSRLAHSTPIALLAETPQELLAEGTERRLPEELRHETVSVHLVDSGNKYNVCALRDYVKLYYIISKDAL